MLVESSAWIAFLRGNRIPEVEVLVQAMDRKQSVWLAPPILQEVLQGADNAERFAKWDRVFGELPCLDRPAGRAAARAAAQLYAKCRWAGTTLRSANDCLIAVHAIENNMPLLNCDRDFALIAKVERKLVLLPVALR